MTHRRCPRCRKVKPLDRTHWHFARARGNGYCFWCRNCAADVARETRAARHVRTPQTFPAGAFPDASRPTCCGVRAYTVTDGAGRAVTVCGVCGATHPIERRAA